VNTEPRFWKAMVFDFDGTLAELNIDFSAMRTALLTLAAEARIAGDGLSQLPALELIEAAGSLLVQRDPEAATAFIAAARRIVTRLEMDAAQTALLQKGVRELLTELRSRSIQLGVVTRNCRAAILKVFPDIASYCQAVLTREDSPRVKPHPDHLRAALRVLGVSPAAAVMIGDHPMDIRLGRDTGTDTIGVLTGTADREALVREKADLIIDHISDIINIIS
jgi:phosphoglycolate phosphatase